MTIRTELVYGSDGILKAINFLDNQAWLKDQRITIDANHEHITQDLKLKEKQDELVLRICSHICFPFPDPDLIEISSLDESVGVLNED